jgi:hypothetical protein
MKADKRRQQLLSRRATAMEEASRLLLVLRATLRRRHVRCGKPGCHCREGKGHGPFVYLSASHGAGRTRQSTVAPEAYDIAELYVRNYHRLWRVLERISAINWDLLQERLLPDRPEPPKPVKQSRQRVGRGS